MNITKEHTNHFFRPIKIRTTTKAPVSRIAVLFQINSVDLVEVELVESLEETLFVAGDRDVGGISDRLIAALFKM